MTRPVLSRRDPDLEGLRVLVVGLGRSGMAAVELAASRGARVTATDARQAAELGERPRRAEGLGAELVLGSQPVSLAETADLLVLSPGVRPDHALVARARRAGLPVWGEVELAARFCRGSVIGITGSNGKSTVTSMAGTILRASGLAGGTGGNLATPFSELLAEDGADAVHAVELSSFQLESVESLRARAAVIVNLSPDHLDRHSGYEAYARAKARLLELQEAEDFAILNADDPESERFRETVRGQLQLFSTRGMPERGAFVRDGLLVLRTDAGEEPLLPAAELPVPGEHNVANALAAALACRLVGCPPAAVAAGLRGYSALPHRLERVAEIDGVTFYNDSKATNVASTERALVSFPPGRVHLILGGRDKGADWSLLAGPVRRYAGSVLLVGEAATSIAARLAGAAPDIADCGTIERAVDRAVRGARPGDVVLLSPGCASFDQFENFEARGEAFRRAVEARREKPDA